MQHERESVKVDCCLRWGCCWRRLRLHAGALTALMKTTRMVSAASVNLKRHLIQFNPQQSETDGGTATVAPPRRLLYVCGPSKRRFHGATRDQSPNEGLVSDWTTENAEFVAEWNFPPSKILQTRVKSVKANVESLVLKCDLVWVMLLTCSGRIYVCCLDDKVTKADQLYSTNPRCLMVPDGFGNNWNLKTLNFLSALLQLLPF